MIFYQNVHFWWIRLRKYKLNRTLLLSKELDKELLCFLCLFVKLINGLIIKNQLFHGKNGQGRWTPHSALFFALYSKNLKATYTRKFLTFPNFFVADTLMKKKKSKNVVLPPLRALFSCSPVKSPTHQRVNVNCTVYSNCSKYLKSSLGFTGYVYILVWPDIWIRIRKKSGSRKL